MLSFSFAAILATSLGQLPPVGGVPGYVGQYPAGYSAYIDSHAGSGNAYNGVEGYQSTNAFGCSQGKNCNVNLALNYACFAPKCNQGKSFPCLGTYIGPFPSGVPAQGSLMQYGGSCPSGFCPVHPQPQFAMPSFPVQSSIAGASADDKEQHKEINHRLEQLKNILTKLTDSLNQIEKRVENTEKASLSAEVKIKGLQDELKQRWFWQDMESKLDQRIKPLEESIKQLAKRMEQLHPPVPPMPPTPPAPPAPPTPPTGGDGKKAAKSADETMLMSIDEKLDRLHMSVFDQLKKLGDQLNEEKINRFKLEDRVKNLEKPAAKEEIKKDEPKKEDVKKDEKKKEDKEEPKKEEKEGGDMSNLSRLKVARVNLVSGEAPAGKALVIVHLPADAKLYLNDKLTRSVGNQRTFLTPELPKGATFEYALKVEMMHNGKLLSQTRTVSFQAGSQAHIVFEGPRNSVQTALRK